MFDDYVRYGYTALVRQKSIGGGAEKLLNIARGAIFGPKSV